MLAAGEERGRAGEGEQDGASGRNLGGGAAAFVPCSGDVASSLGGGGGGGRSPYK